MKNNNHWCCSKQVSNKVGRLRRRTRWGLEYFLQRDEDDEEVGEKVS